MAETIKQEITEIPFTVSARTARLIGQENFANAEGAVIELVKNSYDADASISLIIINPLINTLYILDNGEGMTEEIIRKHWMTIGTDDKKTNIKSKKERVKTGAKGIGRFALDRLGKKCKMLTKTASSECLSWEVDWGQFDNKDAVISDIKAQMHQQDGFYLPHEVLSVLKSFDLDTKVADYWKENKGTYIEITELKDAWDEKAVESLYSNLEILVPPLETNIFSVFLFNTTELNKYGQVYSAICEDYDYKLTATVQENKKVKIKILRNELNVNDLKRNGFFEISKLNEPQYQRRAFEEGAFEKETTLETLVSGFKAIDKNNNLEKIGAFTFTFYFMKRGGGQEKDEDLGKYPYKSVNYSNRSSWLDKFGGIKIFRDNFRVRPYGEPKSSSFDWLDLGKRALSNPTVTRPGYKVRPQQVYGIVNISRIGNINFDDKSSREGIQENDAFTLFKEIIKSIIGLYENDRNQIMMSLKKIYDERNKKEKAKKDAEEKIKSKKTRTEDEKVLIDALEAYKEDIEDLKDEQKLLRVLASAGLIVTSFAHELKNLSDSIVPRTDDLKQVLTDIIDSSKLIGMPDYLNPYIMIDDIRTQDVRLKTWLDFALASVRKDKRSRRTINMVTYIEGLERTWRSLLSRRKVELVIDKWKFIEVNFRGHEIDLDGIFNNLISNSVDAFKRPDAGDKREIKLSFSFNPLDANGINVVYEDSGPGLENEIIDPNEIYQPFFTTKRDDRTGEKIGTGLGMWIVKSTLDEYNGDIEFLKIRPGFKLKLILPHY
ncbi:MAG: sensor histidine kinase [Ignavibacteriales bacterium]|nr:sensor histidine kinase [Ignavibacteriales bacterium]